MANMSGLDLVQGFIARGYSPHQAAALAGHALQESGGNPNDVNQGEGAHGLLQWRLDRWQGLQDFAKSQGKSPNDPNVQMDFVGKEMAGPESKSSQGFLNSGNVTDASAALKPYIRFGDNSGPTRTSNAVGLLAQYQNGGKMPQDTTDPADPTATAAPSTDPAPVSLTAPVGALADASPSTASTLQSLGTALNPRGAAQPGVLQFAPPQQINMPRPSGNSEALAAALAAHYASLGGGNVPQA